MPLLSIVVPFFFFWQIHAPKFAQLTGLSSRSECLEICHVLSIEQMCRQGGTWWKIHMHCSDNLENRVDSQTQILSHQLYICSRAMKRKRGILTRPRKRKSTYQVRVVKANSYTKCSLWLASGLALHGVWAELKLQGEGENPPGISKTAQGSDKRKTAINRRQALQKIIIIIITSFIVQGMQK